MPAYEPKAEGPKDYAAEAFKGLWKESSEGIF